MSIDELLTQVHSVAISGHVKPDGDCIGSVLALYNYMEKNHPQIHTEMFLEDPDNTFRFLRNFERINSRFDSDRTFDLMIVLDCATRERMGKAETYFAAAGKTVCVDHHVSNEAFGDENYVSGGMSSACEVLYGLLAHDRLDKATAECLYTGIVTDTGVFQYESTNAQTMRVAASLMEFGIDTAFIINEAFFAKDWNESRILGYALLKSQLDAGGSIIYSTISQEELRQFRASTGDLGGIVSQLRLVRGVKCAIFLYENGDGTVKVSFRSEDPINVNELAGTFGGGGHVRAAGCTVLGELDTCLEAMLTEARKRVANYQ